MSKLEPLFVLDEDGAITQIRGVGVQQDSHVIAVLGDHEGAAPPRDTAWALSAAYEFAVQLQGEQANQQVVDAPDAQEPQ